MKITVYGYQRGTGGGISFYKEHLSRDYSGGQALAVEVEIPDSLNPYESVSMNTCIEYKGVKYMLDEVLSVGKNGNPILALPSMNGVSYMALKKISEEWVSKAMHL